MADIGTPAGTPSHAALMDGIYKRQRHFYDLTRAWYLLGRDPMLADLKPPPDACILEIGCGTGRNLIHAARLYPDARLFGIDLSSEMLETARANVRSTRMDARITLAWGDATGFDPQALFAQARFERIFMSYTLSMVPDWRAAILQGVSLLAPGGSLHIADFGDCDRLPKAFHAGLLAWLERFHVSPRVELLNAMRPVSLPSGHAWESRRLFRGYAVNAVIRN
jgi:S-adenosylmethionine-diacylgycerolhomoserine-N-methlytransferase